MSASDLDVRPPVADGHPLLARLTTPLGLVLLHCCLWTLVPAAAHLTPPIDTMEVYAWAREWLLVSNKHPNMAGWVLGILEAITGANGWSGYLASQICTGVAMWFVYLLGREVTDRQSAGLGAALLCTVGYFNWFSPQFNANVVSMPFWAAFVWAVWMARRDGTLSRWAIVGVIGAGVVYCKISGASLLAIAGVYALVDARLRGQLATPGPWVAAAVCLALFAPAALNIHRNGYMIFENAASKLSGVPNPVSFLRSQVLMCAAMLAVLWVSSGRTREKAGARAAASDALRFVTVFALAPILLFVVQSVLTGTRMRDLWAIPMGNLFALAAVLWLGRSGFAIDGVRARRAILMVIAVCPFVYGAAKLVGGKEQPSVNWPQHEVARRFEALWEAETKAPLKLVGGDTLEAGMVALTAKRRPPLLFDLRPHGTPWIDRGRIARDGMLVIWPVTYQPGFETTYQATAGCPPGRSQSFAMRRGPPLVLYYCIIPPRG
jgi:4-amino-4-deoxy-L-arabinose transferase-like glycosyltransferase